MNDTQLITCTLTRKPSVCGKQFTKLADSPMTKKGNFIINTAELQVLSSEDNGCCC